MKTRPYKAGRNELTSFAPQKPEGRIFVKARLLKGLICAALFLSGSYAQNLAFAQSPAKDGNMVRAQSDLERIRREIEDFRPDLEALREERADLDRERKILQAELVRIAGRIQASEMRIARLEEDITALNLRENELEAGLRTERIQTSKTLSAMGRLSLAPSGPVGSTEGAPETVQAAILLRGLTRELKLRAEKLRADIERLTETRKALDIRRGHLRTDKQNLAREEAQMKILLSERNRKLAENNRGLQKSEAKLTRLTKKAQSVEALIESVREYERRQAEKERLRRAEEVKKAEELRLAAEKIAAEAEKKNDTETRVEARRTAARAAQTLAEHKPSHLDTRDSTFYARKGRLHYPVLGRVVRQYGARTAAARRTEGITLQTQSRALVTAPVSGSVSYAGSFRDYGKMLMIKASDSYVVLISGLGELTVKAGQAVANGEPVGRAKNAKAPKLYLELRKNRQTVNPALWFE